MKILKEPPMRAAGGEEMLGSEERDLKVFWRPTEFVARHAAAFDFRERVLGKFPHVVDGGAEEDHHEDVADAEAEGEAEDPKEDIVFLGFGDGEPEELEEQRGLGE